MGRTYGTIIIHIPKDELEDLYEEQELSIRRIAQIKNCSYSAVRRNLIENGIILRNISEGTRISKLRRLELEKTNEYMKRW